MSHSKRALLEHAGGAWGQVFNATPFTSLWMLDYLRKKAGVSYEELLDSERSGGDNILSRRITKRDIEEDYSLSYHRLLRRPGRCTTFAIQVVKMIEKRHGKGEQFDFKLYDLAGEHRLARCMETTILIDSLSKKGAFFLPEGRWKRIDGEYRSTNWKWKAGISKFESNPKSRNGRPLVSTFLPKLPPCQFTVLRLTRISERLIRRNIRKRSHGHMFA
jgi:hypothetical protein